MHVLIDTNIKNILMAINKGQIYLKNLQSIFFKVLLIIGFLFTTHQAQSWRENQKKLIDRFIVSRLLSGRPIHHPQRHYELHQGIRLSWTSATASLLCAQRAREYIPKQGKVRTDLEICWRHWPSDWRRGLSGIQSLFIYWLQMYDDHGRPQGFFLRGAKPQWLTKMVYLSAHRGRKRRFSRCFRRFRLNLRVGDASAEGASKSFRAFCTETAYDVTICKFQRGGSTAPGCHPSGRLWRWRNVVAEMHQKQEVGMFWTYGQASSYFFSIEYSRQCHQYYGTIQSLCAYFIMCIGPTGRLISCSMCWMGTL